MGSKAYERALGFLNEEGELVEAVWFPGVTCWRCDKHASREPGFSCQGCFEWMTMLSDDDPKEIKIRNWIDTAVWNPTPATPSMEIDTRWFAGWFSPLDFDDEEA